MRQLAELLSDRGVAEPALRQGRHRPDRSRAPTQSTRPTSAAPSTPPARRPRCGSWPGRPATDSDRISVYALGEGTIHAMALAGDTSPGAPKIHSLGLLQPLAGRYLDIITNRVRAADASRRRRAVDTTWRGRRRRGAHQGHRARQAARGARRNPQPGQRQGRRGSRQDRSAGAGRRDPRGHAGVADVFGLRRAGQLRRL